MVKDIDEWNILSLKNNIIVQKLKIKMFNFLSTLFNNKDFISQESWADFKKKF